MLPDETSGDNAKVRYVENTCYEEIQRRA